MQLSNNPATVKSSKPLHLPQSTLDKRYHISCQPMHYHHISRAYPENYEKPYLLDDHFDIRNEPFSACKPKKKKKKDESVRKSRLNVYMDKSFLYLKS